MDDDSSQEGYIRQVLEAYRKTPGAMGTVRRADRRPHHERHGDLAAGHVAQLRGLVNELVHALEEEVGVLHVGDRPHPKCGRADG